MIGLNTLFLLIGASVLAVLHYIGLELFLYWRFWWFDIVMHGFGGAVVAMSVFSLKDFIPAWPDRLLYLIPVISFVMIVALGWEVFELMIGILIDDTYALDTAIDLMIGLLGGVTGWFAGQAIRNV